MKAWSTWFPDLLPQLPGCPDPMIELALRRACQEFFDRSRAWRVVQAAVPIAANQSSVTLAPTDISQELVRVEAAWLDSLKLEVRSLHDIDTSFSDDWQTHTGSASSLVQMSPGLALLYPVPIAAAVTGLKFRLSVKPSESATGIPDDLYSKYKDALAAGAMSRLMMQPDKKWSNSNVGMVNAAMFNSAIHTATAQAARSFGGGRISARPMFA